MKDDTQYQLTWIPYADKTGFAGYSTGGVWAHIRHDEDFVATGATLLGKDIPIPEGLPADQVFDRVNTQYTRWCRAMGVVPVEVMETALSKPKDADLAITRLQAEAFLNLLKFEGNPFTIYFKAILGNVPHALAPCLPSRRPVGQDEKDWQEHETYLDEEERPLWRNLAKVLWGLGDRIAESVGYVRS